MHQHSGLRVAGLLAVLLSGCAHIAPLPLPTAAPLAPSLAALAHQGVDIARPLSVAAVTMLAVQNSPDLAATRTQRGVSQAQIVQAGLLANPSVTASFLPLVAGPAAAAMSDSSTPAWNAGISYDLRVLITRNSRRSEARATAHALDATLLWQEWQTMAQARLLAVDIIDGDRLLAILRHAQSLLQVRADESRAALARGDATLATAAPDITALQTARSAALDQERAELARRHQLNALLGLLPETQLTLATTTDLPRIDPQAVRSTLPTLADRRPDLAALRFGYDAENARLRTAILSQFPNLTLGVTGGSDNSNVRNAGPQANFDLPIFDHNQGQIGIEQATRAQLHAEYAARLAAAYGQVGAMLSEIDILQHQITYLQKSLPPLRSDAATARAAQASGDLDERTALDLIVAPVTREQEIETLEQTLAEQIVSLATLTGAGLPTLHVMEDGS